MRKVLYVTYDGLTDPLGQSQIIPYLQGLTKFGYQYTVLSFEKNERYEKEKTDIISLLEPYGISWKPLSFTRKPPLLSKFYDMLRMRRTAYKLHRQNHFDIIHCRSYMASDIGIFLKKKFGVKFIFDMRGWWADEKKESGEWTKWYYQPVYKYYKKREKIFFLNADQIISLTYSGCDEIMKNFSIDNKKIEVIPTCVDFEIFKPFSENKREEIRKELNILMHSVVLVYSGSLGGNYNVESLIQVFNNLCTQFENSFLLVLLKDDLVAKVEDQLQQNGIKNFKILSVPFKSVTNYLMAADIGLVFYDITFSVIGRSPTKLGEYWASGLPVIITSGIGDIDRLDKRYPMGIILNKEGKFDIKEKFQDFPVSNRAMLRDYARSYFGLEKGVELYAGVYNKLFKN